jgi:hypothetical protein
MGVRDFHNSATKLFVEKGATDEEKQIYLEAVLKDRGEKYISKLQKKYPRSLVQKAKEFYEGLSEMEKMDFSEHFEKVIPAAIEANPERFMPSEIKAIFNSDGTVKALTPGVFDSPARDVDRARLEVEDVIVEEPLEPPPPKEEPTISFQEARTMDLGKLRSMLPKTGDEE